MVLFHIGIVSLRKKPAFKSSQTSMSSIEPSSGTPAMLKRLEAEVRFMLSIAVQDYGFDIENMNKIIAGRKYYSKDEQVADEQVADEQVADEQVADEQVGKFTFQTLKEYLMNKCKIIKSGEMTCSQPGSIKYLMFGSEPSEQSICIKMGKLGEEMIKKIILETANLELLHCGVQCIDPVSGKNKDLDLIWVDNITKTIYYREAKGNIELDSEKLPATIDKMVEIINTHISPNYPEYTTDIGVFNWSVYNRAPLKKGLSQIKKCEEMGIKVEHPEDLFGLLKFDWDEEDYYKFFLAIGKLFRE
jgi:hypothetical protein